MRDLRAHFEDNNCSYLFLWDAYLDHRTIEVSILQENRIIIPFLNKHHFIGNENNSIHRCSN